MPPRHSYSGVLLRPRAGGRRPGSDADRRLRAIFPQRTAYHGARHRPPSDFGSPELGGRKHCPEDSMTRSRRGGARDLRQGRGQRRVSRLGRVLGAGQHPTRTLVTGWSAIGLTFLLVATALVGYVKYRGVLDGINHIAVTDLGKRPPKFNNAMNLLLI